MNRDQLYQHLPLLIKRLFTWGLLASTLFLSFWYFGGLNLWGPFVSVPLKMAWFLGDIQFQSGSTESAALLMDVVLEHGGSAQLKFPINLLNMSVVEVITLLALLPRDNWKSFFRLAAWCFLFTWMYHCFHASLQLYQMKIGPDLAGQVGMFWEPTTWYTIVENIAAFDTFILRYWAGFPIFGLALLVDHLVTTRQPKPAHKKSGKRQAAK